MQAKSASEKRPFPDLEFTRFVRIDRCNIPLTLASKMPAI
jgi:hypothetical protein